MQSQQRTIYAVRLGVKKKLGAKRATVSEVIATNVAPLAESTQVNWINIQC